MKASASTNASPEIRLKAEILEKLVKNRLIVNRILSVVGRAQISSVTAKPHFNVLHLRIH